MRHARDRAKLTTGVGILTMLLGAMFVIAPSAGATPRFNDVHKVTICHRTNSVTNPYVTITVDFASVNGQVEIVHGPDHTIHAGPVFDFDAADAPGYDTTYPTPRNGDQWGDIIPPFTFEGGSFPGSDNWDEGGAEAYNEGECGPLAQLTPSVTLVKTNDANDDASFTDNELAPTTGATVDFQIVITNNGEVPLNVVSLEDTWPGLSEPLDLLEDVDLTCADGGGPVTLTSASVLAVGSVTTCTFTLTGYSPGTGGSKVNTVTLDVDELDDAVQDTSTVRSPGGGGCVDNPNTEEDECNPEIPTPDPASLTVVKAVAGDDAPDDWTFPFTVTNLGGVNLTDDDPEFSEIELDAGNYTITESDAGDADLTDIICSAGADVLDTTIADDGSTGSVSVALDEGDAVTCTFTNTFPDVEGSVVVNPPTPEPAAGPEAEVLGEQVVRTLPRTGSTNGPLAVLGFALLLVGATLVGGSRLRLRYVD